MQIIELVCFGVWLGTETRRQCFHQGAWIFVSSVLCVLMMWCYGLGGGWVEKAGHRRRTGTSRETEEANTKLPRSRSYCLLCSCSVLSGNWLQSKTYAQDEQYIKLQHESEIKYQEEAAAANEQKEGV